MKTYQLVLSIVQLENMIKHIKTTWRDAPEATSVFLVETGEDSDLVHFMGKDNEGNRVPYEN